MEIIINESLMQNSRDYSVVTNLAARELLEFVLISYDSERDHFTIEGVSKKGRRVLEGRLSDGFVSSKVSWDFDRGLVWANELDYIYLKYSFDDVRSISELVASGVPWRVIDEIAIRNSDRAKQDWEYN